MRVTTSPAIICGVTSSSRNNHPQKIAKNGMRKVNDVATVAPELWINLKKNTKASEVQKSARTIALPQLTGEGIS